MVHEVTIDNDDLTAELIEGEVLSHGLSIGIDGPPRKTTILLSSNIAPQLVEWLSSEGWSVDVTPEYVMASRYETDDNPDDDAVRVEIYPWHRILSFVSAVESGD